MAIFLTSVTPPITMHKIYFSIFRVFMKTVISYSCQGELVTYVLVLSYSISSS